MTWATSVPILVGLSVLDLGLCTRQNGRQTASLLNASYPRGRGITRSATAQKSRVSIHGTKIVGQSRRRVDPVKIFLSSSFITMQNLVTLSHIGVST